jgi:hypothetical protein
MDEILAGETDGWVATQKILAWVFAYIQPDLIPQTLSTEEILTQKRGKCVEYAVLFAAIARAAGLPTRMALGERYQDGAWVGHMWNEVWLGEWIAVDASHNQITPDALLLKFVDSDTVMGTQKVRTGLIGQLGIIIEDVKVPQEEIPAVAVLKTGIADNLYTNAEFRCRIQAPAGWKMIETKEQGTPLLVMQKPDDPSSTAILVLSSVPFGTTAEQILQSRIQLTKAAVEEFTLIRQEQTTLGGTAISKGALSESVSSDNTIDKNNSNDNVSSESVLGENNPGDNTFNNSYSSKSISSASVSEAYPVSVGAWSFSYQGSKTCQENWIRIQNDFLYLFVFTAPEIKWEDYQSVFQEIRNKFQIL